MFECFERGIIGKSYTLDSRWSAEGGYRKKGEYSFDKPDKDTGNRMTFVLEPQVGSRWRIESILQENGKYCRKVCKIDLFLFTIFWPGQLTFFKQNSALLCGFPKRKIPWNCHIPRNDDLFISFTLFF